MTDMFFRVVSLAKPTVSSGAAVRPDVASPSLAPGSKPPFDIWSDNDIRRGLDKPNASYLVRLGFQGTTSMYQPAARKGPM
jgi:hypothetical protein